MDKWIDYWVSFSFTHPSSLPLKAKFMKKSWLHAIVLTWHKQASITYMCILGSTATNKDFPTPLEQVNTTMTGFLLLDSSFTKKEALKNLWNFQRHASMHPMYSMLYTANLGLCDYGLFSQIQSHIHSSKLKPSKFRFGFFCNFKNNTLYGTAYVQLSEKILTYVSMLKHLFCFKAKVGIFLQSCM